MLKFQPLATIVISLIKKHFKCCGQALKWEQSNLWPTYKQQPLVGYTQKMVGGTNLS